jgi:hypothetical protein
LICFIQVNDAVRPRAVGRQQPVSGDSPIIEAMKTSMLLAVVLLLQIAAMVVIYRSHVVGMRESGLFGLAAWLLLPLVSSSLACSRLLKGSAWASTGGTQMDFGPA